MAKFISDNAYDAALDYIASKADKQIVCSAQPANYAGVAAVALADVAVDSGDFTKANGDVSGRKLTVAAQNAVSIDTTGDATHVCLVDDTGSELLMVTTCTTKPLTSGDQVNFPAYDYEITDVA